MYPEKRSPEKQALTPMSLSELAKHPTLVKQFTRRILVGGEQQILRYKVATVTLEGTAGNAEFRLSHAQKGNMDLLLEDGRLYNKFDHSDVTNEMTPEKTGSSAANRSEQAA